MKKRILSLALCLALLPLPGCAAMLERGHETITTHVDYAVTEDESILRAETYQGLVNAMLYFVNSHRAAGTIRLYNYTGDVEADLANARDEVVYKDARGAFSVRTLAYEATRVLTYYEVELRIAYSRTAQEMEAIPEVTGLSGVRQELARLVAGQQDCAIFLASYFSGDGALVEQLVRLAYYANPGLCLHHHSIGFLGGLEPDCAISVSLYPETGIRRIIEVKLELCDAHNIDEDAYADRLAAAAFALLEEHPPAGESYTVEELAAIVRNVSGPREEDGGSCLAIDVLSGEGEAVSDFALLMAMEYLCQQCEIEVQPVRGSPGLWLIVAGEDGYRHLLPQGLYPAGPGGEPGEEPAPPVQLLYTDQELAGLGYEWNAALYPACGEFAQPQAENGQDAG